MVELVAVMTVVAVLGAIAVPAMSSTPGMRRRAAAAQVARDLRLARELAATTTLTTWVAFDPGANRYALRVERRDSPGRVHAAGWSDPATGRDFAQQFGMGEWAGVELESVVAGGGTWIGFDWRGRPRAFSESPLAAAATVTIGGPVVVRVEPETGFVEVIP